MKYFLYTEFIEGFHRPLLGKRRHFIDLISIGIVAEDGRKYYAISNDFDPRKADAWVMENVLRPLYEEIVKMDFDRWKIAMPAYTGLPHEFSISNLKKAIKRFGKSTKQIRQEIIDFVNPDVVQQFLSGLWPDKVELAKHNCSTKHGYAQPEFYAYYADYDWVVFCSLFGRMIDLPKGFPMYCKDLKQIYDEKAMKLTSREATKIECHSCTHDMYDYLDKTTDGAYKISVLKKHPDYPKKTNEHNALADAEWNYELYKFLTR